MNTKGILSIATNMKVLLGLLVITTIGISLQAFYYGNINNLVIFRLSFYHLLNHQDIYAWGSYYGKQHVDIFKYSPSFALLMGPMAIFSIPINLFLWNLLNILLFFFAVKYLPFDNKMKSFILLLSLPELIISTQCNQSNTLM